MTGSACASGRLKREQQYSKDLVHLARRHKLDYAERRQQEHAAKAARQQELASLQDALQPAANAANSPATREPAALKPTENSICITASRPNVIVVKTKLEDEAENSTASPKIAAVKPAMSVSSAAAPAEEQATVKTAGAATTSMEMANAAEVVSSGAASLQKKPCDTSAQHKANSQLLQSSSMLAASLPLQHSQLDLVQHAIEELGQSECDDVSAASHALPVQARDEGVKKQSGRLPQEMLHGELPEEADIPNLIVKEEQVS